MKHTPGPWNVVDDSDDYGGGWLYVVSACGKTISGHSSDSSEGEAYEANARLVAAAPELLSDLKIAVSRLADPKMSTHWETREDWEAEIESYKKVIAKAEGRE